MRRRELLAAGAVLVAVRPALATPASMEAAIRAFTGGPLPPAGGVTLDIAPLVENGNAVPVTLRAAGRVAQFALFTSRNPQPEVAVFTLGPRSGRAEVATRLRLATSQDVVAVARFADGSFGSQSVAVEVTLAACIE